MLTDEATLLVNQCLVTTVRTLLTLGFCSVLNVFLQGTFHTVLPRVDALAIELERTYQLDYLFDRHTVAQHAGNQLGIVPILFVELLGKSLHGSLVSALVLELEVVALATLLVSGLDNAATGHTLGQDDTLFIVLQTGEDFVGITVEQTYEGHPLLFVVLEV